MDKSTFFQRLGTTLLVLAINGLVGVTLSTVVPTVLAGTVCIYPEGLLVSGLLTIASLSLLLILDMFGYLRQEKPQRITD